jgi:hypothetical protein
MPCSKLEVPTAQHGTLSGAGYLHQSPFSKGKRWTQQLNAISPRGSESFTFIPFTRMSMGLPKSLPSKRALTISRTTTIGTPTSPLSTRRHSAPF